LADPISAKPKHPELLKDFQIEKTSKTVDEVTTGFGGGFHRELVTMASKSSKVSGNIISFRGHEY